MMQLDPSSPSISTSSANLIPSENPLQVEAITYMDNDLFKAAKDGDMELFNKHQGDFHCLVDGRQNTALHIYSNTGGRQVVKTDKRFLCFQKRRSEREFSVYFVEQLVNKCSSLLLQQNDRGEIPLHIAAEHGYSDLVEFLIERAKVLQHEDLENGRFEATCRLKQMLRMRDKDGNTAMHKAVQSGDLNVVRLLAKELEYSDFSFSANASGETPLFIAAKASGKLLVAEILDNCKSTDYGGLDGRTALHAAAMANDQRSVRKLIDANKHLTKQIDANGWTPLHYAALYHCPPVAKVLLESDPFAAYITDKERGMTALHFAAWGGKGDIMKDIISYCPGSCEIVDKRGWNFLHFTVVFSLPYFSRFLIGDKNKIKDVLKDLLISNLVNEKDAYGITPWDLLLFVSYYNKQRYGRRLDRVVDFFERHRSKEWDFPSLEMEKQIQQLLKDIVNDAEVARLPISSTISASVEQVEKSKKEEEKEKDISKHEIEENARQSHLVVATLVATVTFAAAFTVPGGYRSNEQGTATLIRDSAFKAFIITNILAFVSSLLAIFIHFFALMLSVKFKDSSIYDIIRVADHLTIFAMAAMVVAFSIGTYAVLQASSGFAITALSFGLIFFPFPVYCYLMWFLISIFFFE